MSERHPRQPPRWPRLALASTSILCGLAVAEPAQVGSSPPRRAPFEEQRTLPVAALADAPPSPPPGLGHLSVDGELVAWRTIALSEDFEGSVPSPGWRLLEVGAPAGWGRSTERQAHGAASAWCAQSGAAAATSGGPVPNRLESWMVVGPLDFGSVTRGTLGFDLFLDTEEGADAFYVGASTAFPSFTMIGSDQDTLGFERFSIDLRSWGSLGDLTGRAPVWLAFLYVTDASTGFEGAYVDQIALDVGVNSGLGLFVHQVDGRECPTMRAFASVTDGQGRPVQGLEADDFALAEDGDRRRLTVEPVTGTDEPLALALVVDGSGSLEPSDLANLQAASGALVDRLRPADSVAVYHFGTAVTRARDYTTSRAAARAALGGLTNGLGNTSLYDAIVSAAEGSAEIEGRKALLVVTDGTDNDSVATEQIAIEAAIAAGTPVFTVGFGNVDPAALQRVADRTGGLFLRGEDSKDLAVIFDRIREILEHQYVLTWSAGAADGGTHTLEIESWHEEQSASRARSYSQEGTPCAKPARCRENATTLCLDDDRFRVELTWTSVDGTKRAGQAAPHGADDSGAFWFFDQDNWEVLVKVLDGCAINGHHWVFAAAATDVGYELTITDTRSRERRTYSNPAGVMAPAFADTTAFATCQDRVADRRRTQASPRRRAVASRKGTPTMAAPSGEE